ncbi:MAG: hypothetical protein V3U88_12220 [Methylococcales bacterium]
MANTIHKGALLKESSANRDEVFIPGNPNWSESIDSDRLFYPVIHDATLRHPATT